MRKGDVFVIVKSKFQKDSLFDYICTLLKATDVKYRVRKNDIAEHKIDINGYRITITESYSNNKRGYRPEIVYIDVETDRENYNLYEVIIPKSFLSTRKQAVRFVDLDNISNFDLQELIDDDYALQNTIDMNKNNEWEFGFEK